MSTDTILQLLAGVVTGSVFTVFSVLLSGWLARRAAARAARKPTQEVQIRSRSGKFIKTITVPTHPTEGQRRKVDQELSAAAAKARRNERPLAGVK